MKKSIPWLSGLLTVQLVITMAFFIKPDHASIPDQETQLISFNPDEIDEIVITENDEKGDHNLVKLKLEEENWKLPNYEGLPARSSSVENFLSQLENLKRHWPVAKTDETLKRFEVSDDDFGRKVDLFSKGDHVTSLYFGTSPTFKQIHVRIGKESTAYAVNMNQHDIKSSSEDWLDTRILAHKSDINAIRTDELELIKNKSSEDWTLKDLKENEVLETDEVKRLTSAIKNINIQSLISKDKRDEIKTLDPEQTLSYEADDRSVTYKGFKYDDQYIIQSSEHPLPFSIAEYEYKRIFDLSRDRFIQIDSDQLAQNDESDTTDRKLDDGDS